MEKKVTRKREKYGVITHVEVDDQEKTKQEVLNDVNVNEYYTYPDGKYGKRGERIYKTTKNHLTTKSNDNTRDNLDSLNNF